MSKHVELGNLVRRISHMYIQPHKECSVRTVLYQG